MTRDEIRKLADLAGWTPTQLEMASDAEWARLERFAALVVAAEREAAQRAFWEACRPHGKVGEVIYTTYKHLHARSEP